MNEANSLRRTILSEIVKAGYTQKTFCEAIGMPQSTFYRKLQKGLFYVNEAEQIASVLGLQLNFFAKKLT